MIKSIGAYDFPSRSAEPLYGDDMLLHVLRADSMFFCSAVTFRAPKAMSFDDFYNGMVLPLMSTDPDFDASMQLSWKLVDDAFVPDGAKSLADNGIRHKNTLTLIGA